MDGKIDGWKDRWMKEWMDEKMDEWMDGLTFHFERQTWEEACMERC